MQLTFNTNAPRYMTEFAAFACLYLGLDRLRGNIEIEYKYGSLEDNCYGQCWGDKKDCEIQIASRQFGYPISRREKLMTIAHELTHARQYLKGELLPTEEGKRTAMWRGTPIKYNPRCEETQPWEVEASKYEDLIYDAWVGGNYQS
jgi:hypothetical protein